MKVLFLSFLVGLGVGALYGLIRVKSPAPPIVALLGLLGMVLGEQVGIWIQTRKLDVPRAAADCLVGEPYDRAEVGRVPQVRQSVPGPKTMGRNPSNAFKLCPFQNCRVPHTPDFLSSSTGSANLHAPFLQERRTRGPIQC